jgi:hypothetical protein
LIPIVQQDTAVGNFAVKQGYLPRLAFYVVIQRSDGTLESFIHTDRNTSPREVVIGKGVSLENAIFEPFVL